MTMKKMAGVIMLGLLLWSSSAFALEFVQGFTGNDVNFLVLNPGSSSILLPTASNTNWLGLSQGWWNGTSFANSDDNDNHFVGYFGSPSSPDPALRNFFSFDLTNVVQGSVIDGVLRLNAGSGASDTGRTTQPYSLWDVRTDVITLNRNNGTSAAIFNDLGSGVPYGVINFPFGGVPVDIFLNANAIADINAAAGAFWSVGGRLDDRGHAPVPEPGTWLLLATGGAGLLGYGWRRRQQAVER